MSDPRTVVGVVFGGVSPEHEVSVISAIQAMAAMDDSRFRAVPVYVAKDGTWHTGSAFREVATFKRARPQSAGRAVSILPDARGRLVLEESPAPRFRKRWTEAIDVVFPVVHGGSGEDGGLQGLCDMLGVAFVGSSVLGSAVGMDKVVSKHLCARHDIAVVPFVEIRESEWAGEESKWLKRCADEIGFPAIVKPVRLGSSIGIGRVADEDALDSAIEEAFRYDGRVMVEKAITPLRELNCSVLGQGADAVASVLEEPVGADGSVLSFRDKYLRGGSKGAKSAQSDGMASLDRIIPAEVDPIVADRVRTLAIRVFRAFDCGGVARIDFLMDAERGDVYFNEINTIPGSLSFYLWEASGITFPELVSRMIDGALARAADRAARIRVYDVNLLSEKDLGGLKGPKQRA